MSVIIGNPVGTGLAKSNLMQNDPTKGDYVHGKEEFIQKFISGKLDASELPTAINAALAQAKENGEFDGADGHTPVKGVEYFTEADKMEMVSKVIASLPVYAGEVVDV